MYLWKLNLQNGKDQPSVKIERPENFPLHGSCIYVAQVPVVKGSVTVERGWTVARLSGSGSFVGRGEARSSLWPSTALLLAM